MAVLTTCTRFRAELLICFAILLAACSSPEAQKKRHFEQGNAYAAQKRDDFAVIEYANAVRIDPKFGDARLKLAQTYERMGNLRAAIPEFVRAADALPNNRDAQIKAIQVLLFSGRFEDAKARATTLLSKNPKDVDVLLLRANAMSALKDPDGATAEIEEALKVDPNNSSAFLSLGGVRVRSGEAKEAEAAYKQAIALKPSSVEAHLGFAAFLWSASRPAEAEQEIKNTLSLQPRNLLANRMLAAMYRATKRLSEAEQPLKVIAEVSQTPAAKYDLVEYYLSVRRDDEATKLLTALAGDQATFARAEAILAGMDYARGRKQEAHARLDKLLVRAPKDSPALVMKTQWLTSEQKIDQALDTAKAAVAADGQSATAHYYLGLVHSIRGEVPEAIKEYTETLRLNPRLRAAQIQLSRVNLVKGDRAAAIRYAEEAMQASPSDVDARIALVRGLLAGGGVDLTRAEMEINALLRDWPKAAEVHNLNGTFQAMRNNTAAARISFNRALELAPGNLDAFGGLVAVDLKEKPFNDAAKRVDAELAKQPDRPEVLALGATVFDQAGQKDKAEQALRRVISVAPNFLGGYLMLGQFYARQGRLDEARTEYENIIKKDPRSVGARTMVGIILDAQGKREEAKRAFQAAVAESADLAPVAANNLAFIYAEEGTNLDVALTLATSAKKALPDNGEIDDTLGWVYYKKDLASLAIVPLEESAKKRPGSATALYHLGMAYAKINDVSKARPALERALKMNLRPADAASARQALAALPK